MKYWIAFINFIFSILRELKLGLIYIYKALKALWMPIYGHIHPTAIICIDWFNGKKTYIVSIFSIIGLILAHLEGSVALSSLLSTLPCLVVAMTIRHGMARNAVSVLEGGTVPADKKNNSST